MPLRASHQRSVCLEFKFSTRETFDDEGIKRGTILEKEDLASEQLLETRHDCGPQNDFGSGFQLASELVPPNTWKSQLQSANWSLEWPSNNWMFAVCLVEKLEASGSIDARRGFEVRRRNPQRQNAKKHVIRRS